MRLAARFCTAAVLLCALCADLYAQQNIISFSGYDWKIKSSGSTKIGPGPNFYSRSPENVWVDDLGMLHLKIRPKDGRWYCSEVICNGKFGYGQYIFHLASRVDKINENAVLGLFTWSDSQEYAHREMEFEFSRWGNPHDINAQCVIQPYEKEGNLRKFRVDLESDDSVYTFTWGKDVISFLGVQGDSIVPKMGRDVIIKWDYKKKGIPVPGDEKVRLNLWLYGGKPPSDSREVEVIVKKFEFIPQTSHEQEKEASSRWKR